MGRKRSPNEQEGSIQHRIQCTFRLSDGFTHKCFDERPAIAYVGHLPPTDDLLALFFLSAQDRESEMEGRKGWNGAQATDRVYRSGEE